MGKGFLVFIIPYFLVDAWVLTILFSIFFCMPKIYPHSEKGSQVQATWSIWAFWKWHYNLTGRRKTGPTNGKWSFRNQQCFPHTLALKLSIANNHSENYGKIPCKGLRTSPKFQASIPEKKYSKMPLVPRLVPNAEFISLKKVFTGSFLGSLFP